MKNKELIILIVVLTVISVVLAHLLVRRKKKNEIQEIRDKISSGEVGGSNTILGLLSDVQPSSNIDAFSVARYLEGTWTSEKDILERLGTMSKSEIKAVALAYPSANEESMDDALRSDFGDSDFNNVLSVVRNAR